MHVDVFFSKPSQDLEKIVYFTLIYRSDQSKLDTMNIAEHVLKQFIQDYPQVNDLYGKSDNAGSYHGNQILENLYKLCKKYHLTLVRYDYNEPCRGKDQCDRESAGGKTVINSYVNAGNDVLSAVDIYNALQYGSGVRNAKASVVEIDSSTSDLSGPSIPAINSYHSVQFNNDHMKLHRYFNIGKGTIVKYSDQSNFSSSLQVRNEFTSTSSAYGKCRKKKASAKSLFFCPDLGCTEVFEVEEDFENHLLSGKHKAATETSAMDKVRSCFVRKMKLSSSEHLSHPTTKVTTVDETMTDACSKVSLMSFFAEQGWAIPTRAFYRYPIDLKKFLYDLFIEGEDTGRKKSPEEVEQLVRANFSADKYVTVQQIRSLFTRFSTAYREGTLKDPTEDTQDNTMVQDNVDIADELYQNDFDDAVDDVMSVLATWETDTWVVVKYGKKWYPGTIMNPEDEGIEIEDGFYMVNCMERRPHCSNQFRWPSTPDIEIYSKNDLLTKIDGVKPIQQNNDWDNTVWCVLDEQDIRDANDALKRALREE